MSDTLPAIISRAGQRLLGARNSGELLEAKKIAEAALHYAKVTKAANETHADCIRIITRAEMRMANEIDAGQARGEIRTRTDNQHVRTTDKLASLDDLGIPRQRVSEWREVRDAGEGVIESVINKALEEGRAPTKTEVLKEVQRQKGKTRNVSRKKDAFLIFANEALKLAKYDGPVDDEVIEAARDTHAAWGRLVSHLEGKK